MFHLLDGRPMQMVGKKLTFFHRLHMDDDMGLLTKAVLEAAFHLRGLVMSLCEGLPAVQTDMDLGGNAVADTPRPQVVRVLNAVHRLYNPEHFLLSFCGK